MYWCTSVGGGAARVHTRARIGVVQSWFAQIGGTWLVGVWPVAHMSIQKRLTVPVRFSGSIRKRYTACGGARAGLACKTVPFVWLTRRWGWSHNVPGPPGQERWPRAYVLRTCPSPARGKRKPVFAVRRMACPAAVRRYNGNIHTISAIYLVRPHRFIELHLTIVIFGACFDRGDLG